jgi:hypothetical protein
MTTQAELKSVIVGGLLEVLTGKAPGVGGGLPFLINFYVALPAFPRRWRPLTPPHQFRMAAPKQEYQPKD